MRPLSYRHRSSRTCTMLLAGLLLAIVATGVGTPAAYADSLAPLPVVLSTSADLRIQSVTVTKTAGDTYMVFVVKNAGGIGAGPFTVEIRAGNGALVQAVASGGLGPGNTLTIFHKLPGCVPYGLLTRRELQLRVDLLVAIDARDRA
jgi:hypothetical protein